MNGLLRIKSKISPKVLGTSEKTMTSSKHFAIKSTVDLCWFYISYQHHWCFFPLSSFQHFALFFFNGSVWHYQSVFDVRNRTSKALFIVYSPCKIPLFFIFLILECLSLWSELLRTYWTDDLLGWPEAIFSML